MEGSKEELKTAAVRLAWIARSMTETEEQVHKILKELLIFADLCEDPDDHEGLIDVLNRGTGMFGYLADIAHRQKLRIEIELKERELQALSDELHLREGER